ncbi:MAG: clan AA aspartic protease [Algicola sp.]|nr:clan AA aspartic protease [Algicola sp.]
MKINILIFFIVLFTLSNCSSTWSDYIDKGTVSKTDFEETTDIELINNLVITEVKIKGKTYKFLFDSGAPLSISETIQNDLDFKILSSDYIVDSDNNRKKVDWVQLDEIQIGKLSFNNQTAFVGNFSSNPVLKCLGIDGIIGSNLIRQMNTTINQQEKSIIFSDKNKPVIDYDFSIPFKSDVQHNIFIDLKIGDIRLNNVLIDYGSNAGFSIDADIWSKLKANGIIEKTITEEGIQQAGIIGEPILFLREYAIIDDLSIGNHELNVIVLRTGKTTSIGNRILSKYLITIDWKTKTLYFTQDEFTHFNEEYYGFKLGYSKSKNVYIQSVIENSQAQKLGVLPNYKVTKFDEINFNGNEDFCDYVFLKKKERVYIEVEDSNGRSIAFTIKKEPLSNLLKNIDND